MKPSLRGASPFALAHPTARVVTRLARVTLVLALVLAATLPSSAGDRRRAQRAVGKAFVWGEMGATLYGQPRELSGLSGLAAIAGGPGHGLALKTDGRVWAWGSNSSGQLGDGTTVDRFTPVEVIGLSDVVAISAGYYFSLALKSDGTVWAWGANTFGQLGNGTITNSRTPVQVGSLSGVVAIAGGSHHSLALRSDGTVWAWGANDVGQLGNNPPWDSSVPVRVSSLAGVVAVAAGVDFSLALKSDGTVWAWGSGASGQLGNGTTGNTSTPVQASSLSGAVAISSGSSHSLALKSDGTVWAWGANAFGALGNGTRTNSNVPVQVSSLSGAVAIAGGALHTVALRSDGTVWAWGANDRSQLGNGTWDDSNVPVKVSGVSGAVAIAASGDWSLALQSQALGAAWGDNTNGYLGNAVSGTSNVPTAVDALTGLAAVSAGGFHSVAVRSDGTVWTWGYNGYGEMGIGQGLPGGSTPTQVMSGTLVKKIATGQHHTLALTSTGAVWAWGENENGQTGVGTVDSGTGYVAPAVSYVPVEASGIAVPVVAVATGALHSLALDSGGNVWAWGYNVSGQVGDGTYRDGAIENNRPTPAQVLGPGGTGHLTGVVGIAGGAWHSLALMSNGTVWAWGDNRYGQLGTNGTTLSTSPVQVVDLSDPSDYLTGVVAIAAGSNFSLALKADGTVRAWGNDGIGQLGNGTAGASLVPVPVLATDATHYLTGVVAITASYEHALALKSNGLLLAWGWNSYGQLGNGATTVEANPTPVHVLGPQAPSAISAGYRHSLALALTPTPDPAITGYITITAENKTMTYGGTRPQLTYTSDTPLVLDTEPTCVSAASGASNAGTYAIVCSGAATTGYLIDYVPGTLTVNPAPLIIIADSKSMGVGSRMPPLTASYIGFMNGDSEATALDTLPLLFLPLTADGTVPGTFPIGVGLVTARNYSITTMLGQLTVTPGALNLFNNFFVTGDYAVGSASLRSGPGTITVATPAGGAIPQGAHILAAFLYWQTVESAASAPASGIQFRGYRVLGAQQLGSDIGFTDGTLTGVLRTYRANVLPYLPVTSPGLSGTPVSVSMPADWANVSRHAIGASLVVVYRVLSNEKDLSGNYVVPLKAVVLYDGSWVPPGSTGTMNQDIKGFYEAAPGSVGTATAIVNTGTDWTQQTMLDLSLSGSDHIALASENIAAGGVMVLSTPVNAGADGLLASWKAALGYFDARDGSWVALPGVTTVRPPAALPEDLFVQIDYMCSLVKADGTCDTVNGHSHLPKLQALQEVAQAFENHGINVHFDVGNNYQGQPHIVPALYAKGGNIIPEETCTDADPTKPQCVVPNEPGLVGWKLGLGLAKMGPRDPNACAATGDCSPRFQPGRKDSYHYALFAHSIATPAWSFWNGNLVSISINVAGDTATITTSVPHGLGDALPNGAPARITIAEAISQPYLNGIYAPTVVNDTTFTISIKNVAGPINSTTDPGLAIYSGKKSSSSGYSDVGGADMVITLGNWKFCLDAQNKLTTACSNDSPQDDSLRVNVQAGTLMHELGHQLGLTHGGTYYQTPGTYLATYEANCKPNYQSVMNYLFQIDLLGPNHNVLDYSGQALGGAIRETLGGNASAWAPTYSTTSWYSPDPYFGAAGQSPATRHCDGTPKALNETMYRWDAAVSSLTWLPNQDVNFDGKHADDLQGYDDWSTYNLRQIGATGSHFVLGGVLLPNGGGIVLPNGGGIVLPNGGGVLLPDGSVVLPNGAGVLLPNGGGVQLPNGGGVLLAGGEVLLPNGGGVLLPNGGGVLLPDGTVVPTGAAGVQLPNGGGILLPNGGGVQLPNGGGIVLPNGGGVLLPNGGGILLANGGGVLLPNGGGVQLPNGGGILLPNGGGVQLPNGGGVLLPNGGGVLLGDGTVVPVPTGAAGVQLPNGGGILLPNGGGVQLPNGGGIVLPNGGGVLLPNGGGILLPNGGGIQLANGGGVLLPNGGGVVLPNGGGVQLPNGGGVLLPNGGGIQLANGGGIQLPNGGGVLLPNGGGILLPNGGGIQLANGGGIQLANGGGITLPNGGGVLLPNGGGVLLPNGGGVLFPNGGGGEMDYETANSFVRPPYRLTKTQAGSGIRLDWQAPNFGVISAYKIYRGDGTVACEVTGNPPPTTCPVNSTTDTVSTDYRATTIVPDETGQLRASQPSEPAVLKVDQTITFGVLPGKWYGDQPFEVSATASPSQLAVSFSAAGNCTVSGTLVSLTSVGSCTITAWQPGDQQYNPAPSVSRTFAISEFQDQTISFSALPNKTFGDPDFPVSATASSGLPVSFGAVGNCTMNGNTVHLTGVGSCTVTASRAGNTVYEAAPQVSHTFAISAWTIQGFHSPVSMPQNAEPVWNVVKGGSAVPLKFNIYAGAVEQTALSAVNGGSVALYTVGCQPGENTELPAVIDNTGSTSLRYDGMQFIQNWKTPKKAGVCYAMRMTAKDGSMITGYFRTK